MICFAIYIVAGPVIVIKTGAIDPNMILWSQSGLYFGFNVRLYKKGKSIHNCYRLCAFFLKWISMDRIFSSLMHNSKDIF